MFRENHVHNEIHASRYRGNDARYALVISHGIASHGAIYDKFCVHHAANGVDIWSFDAPGHGKLTTNRPRGQWTLEEWADASAMYAEHVKAETGLPVFSLGSSLGVAAAYVGGILMGGASIPGTPRLEALAPLWRSPDVQKLLAALGRSARLDCGIFFNFDEDYGFAGAGEQKRLDPWNTWTYDLASWGSLFTFEPRIPVTENRKPILIASGGKDPTFPPEIMRKAAAAIAGPVEYYCLEEGTHQLCYFTPNISRRKSMNGSCSTFKGTHHE